jgi:AcrR family transcriptional regulator
MGITDRKQREKEEKRHLIIETAKKLFRENGFERVSLRNIADAIEYSPTMMRFCISRTLGNVWRN